MNYRLATLQGKKSYSSDITEIIDINVRDPISHIVIELGITNGDSVPDGTPMACITNIQIVDGSEVLFNLTGTEAEALDWYHSGGVERPNYNYFLVGNSQRTVILNFGRWFWDEMLAFVPDKFRNPQLKITLDIDAGGSSATANTLEVWAALFDQKDIAPIGFLMGKEVKAYTLTSSGHEYTEMPLDYPYRGFFLQSLKPGTEPNQTIDIIKLSEDGDKRILVNDTTEKILRAIQQVSQPVRESLFCAVDTSNRYQYIMPTTRVTGHATCWNTTAVGGVYALYDGDGGRLKTIQDTLGSNAQITVQGWLPHGVWQIPFGRQDDLEDWYDVSVLGSLQADILAYAMTHTARIFLQQLRRY